MSILAASAIALITAWSPAQKESVHVMCMDAFEEVLENPRARSQYCYCFTITNSLQAGYEDFLKNITLYYENFVKSGSEDLCLIVAEASIK